MRDLQRHFTSKFYYRKVRQIEVCQVTRNAREGEKCEEQQNQVSETSQLARQQMELRP